jgi:hypothetical protein
MPNTDETEAQLKEMLKKIKSNFPDVESITETGLTPQKQTLSENEGMYLLAQKNSRLVQKNMTQIIEQFKNVMIPEQMQAMRTDIVVQQNLLKQIDKMPESSEKIQAFYMLSSVNDQSEKAYQLAINVLDRNQSALGQKNIEMIKSDFNLIHEDIVEIKKQIVQMRMQILKSDEYPESVLTRIKIK